MKGGRDLGVLLQGVFVLDSEEEGALFFDYCLYCVQRDGRNVIQAALAENLYPEGSDEATYLRDMSDAWYSLFLIERVEPGVGIHVKDVIRHTTHLLIDFGFSQSGGAGKLIASRVVPQNGFIMTTGASLPLSDTMASGNRALSKIVRKYWNKNSRPRVLSFEFEKYLAKSIVFAAVHSGVTRHVRYRDPGEPIER